MALPKKRFSKTSPLRRAVEGLGLGLFVGLLGLLLSGVVGPLENRSWDFREALFARKVSTTDQIATIRLDQKSLDWGKTENQWSWPWPREIYGSLIHFLERGGAKAIAFDVVFTEPSSYGVDDDAALAKSIQENGKYVQAFHLTRGKASTEVWLKGFPLPSIPFSTGGDLPITLKAAAADFPVPEIGSKAALLADTQAVQDSDGIIRSASLFSTFDGHFIPSLGLAPYFLAHPEARPVFYPGRLDLGALSVPLNEKGDAILRYRGPSRTHPSYTVQDVLRAEFNLSDGKPADLDPLVFKDKFVYFGFTATGLFDLRPTPLDAVYPGMEVHATVLDNLLNADFIHPVDSFVQALWILFLGLFAGTLIRLCRNSLQTILVFLLVLLVPAGAALALYLPGYWLHFAGPELTVLLVLLAGLVINYAGEGRQKKFIKDAFSQYLSPVVIERLVHNPELLILGGEKRDLSILFSDVRGFTSISERLDPVELTALLNEYLSEVTTIIYQYGGTIDKYEGDAVIAFWNAPLDLPDHAEKSVRAALEYQRVLKEIQPKLQVMSHGVEVAARIGINTGPVVIGNMGSAQRFNYTFFGDAGNLAARLEGMNKQFGTFFMVAQNTRNAISAEDIVFRELSRVAVVGKSEAITVYEPMYKSVYEAKAETLTTFGEGLRLYYEGDFEKALSVMKSVAAVDPPASHYVKKIEELIEENPKDWKGVWVATEK